MSFKQTIRIVFRNKTYSILNIAGLRLQDFARMVHFCRRMSVGFSDCHADGQFAIAQSSNRESIEGNKE